MTSIDVESLLLRVYSLAGDAVAGTSLHEAIVKSARAAGLSGATVLTAKMGFGSHGHIFSDVLSDCEIDRQPVVVEIVDQPDRITSFLPALHDLVRGRRLMTLERAEVIHYAPQQNTLQQSQVEL